MIGDRWRDIEAGKNAGCETVLVNNPASGDCNPGCKIEGLNDIFSGQHIA